MYIPPENMEIQQIYTRLQDMGKQSIAITSASAGDGATSIALALAQHYLLAGHYTLLVDLNLHHPSLDTLLDLNLPVSENNELFESPKLMSTPSKDVALTGIIAPDRRDVIMKLRQPGILEKAISEWQKVYDTVIIDTSPINQINSKNIPPERVAAACDGSLLVVLAGQTNEIMASTAINTLRSAGAQVLGCVYNDRDNPTLKTELIRETQRLRPRLGRIATYIEGWIQKNRLLSIDV